MSFCMVVCHASQALLRAGRYLLNGTSTSVQQKREESWFSTRMLGICSKEWEQDRCPSFFPSPQASIQAYKAAITLRVLLGKNLSISGKIVENNEIFKWNKRDNNFIKRQQKMVGDDSQIRNQISLTHLEKEGENNAEERLFLYQFFNNAHQSHYKTVQMFAHLLDERQYINARQFYSWAT